MRCKFCRRVLTDPTSQRRGYGKECATKGDTPQSRRLDAVAAVARQPGLDQAFAQGILRRLEGGRRLSPRQDRFVNRLLANAAAEALDAEVTA